jgi:hypothetical protein
MSAPQTPRSAPQTPRSRRVAPPRDQAPSTFTSILARLVAVTPTALAAALVDFEGETVDYAGHMDTFELKIAAAHWQIALSEIEPAAPSLGALRTIVVRARGRGYHVRRLPERYSVVLMLHPRAAFAVSERAMEEAVRRLSVEAGWPAPPDGARWFGVDVETARRGRVLRPSRLKLGGEWLPLEVMGALMGLAPREKGFRVRLPNGAEMMLVRERLGGWFADELLE